MYRDRPERNETACFQNGWNRLPAGGFGRPARNVARSSRRLRSKTLPLVPESELRTPNSEFRTFEPLGTAARLIHLE